MTVAPGLSFAITFSEKAVCVLKFAAGENGANEAVVKPPDPLDEPEVWLANQPTTPVPSEPEPPSMNRLPLATSTFTGRVVANPERYRTPATEPDGTEVTVYADGIVNTAEFPDVKSSNITFA